jgi:hypothetical protein
MKFRLIANVMAACCCAAVVQAAPPIELEVATQQGLQITAPRAWLQLFTAIGINDVRIRAARTGEEPVVTNRGTADRPRYYVLGILTRRNQLRLPGGTFGPKDRTGINDYFERLTADGAASLTDQRGPFGLTKEELAAVFADLTQPIDFETKGQRPQAVVDRLQHKLSLKFALGAKAGTALRTDKRVDDELQGVTVGTGLAMLLRNYGLVMRPEKPRGQSVTLRIELANSDALTQSTLGKDADEHPSIWPIGWEPDIAPVRLAPSLFEQLNAEIDGYSLAETLAAIGPRIKVPIYLDHAALRASKIDPASIQAKLPRMRTTYQHVLNRVLAQARLGTSLRADEAGRPFVWITR